VCAGVERHHPENHVVHLRGIDEALELVAHDARTTIPAADDGLVGH
jgi:hypothetical protein